MSESQVTNIIEEMVNLINNSGNNMLGRNAIYKWKIFHVG